MTIPAIFNSVRNVAVQTGQQYTILYNNVFNNVNGTPAAEILAGFGANAGKYVTVMNDALALANHYDNMIIPTELQIYPQTVTINNDGTVTLN